MSMTTFLRVFDIQHHIPITLFQPKTFSIFNRNPGNGIDFPFRFLQPKRTLQTHKRQNKRTTFISFPPKVLINCITWQVFWLVIFSPSRFHQWFYEKIRPFGREMTLQLRGQPRNFTGFPFLPTWKHQDACKYINIILRLFLF